MSCIKNSTSPLITAHRGASGLAPENTLAAIRLAQQLGAGICEIDVQETGDGRIVLLHDATLTRTTDQKGKIWKLNFTETQNADAGFWFSPDFAGEKIPTLESVIEMVRGSLKLNIELKTNGHQQQLAERVVAVVEKLNFVDQCYVTSFDLSEIQRVKRLNPEIKTGLITSKIPNEEWWNSGLDLFSVNKRLVTAEFVRSVHEAGMELHVWTVNREGKMRKLIELGVDSIITNFPDVLKKILDEE